MPWTRLRHAERCGGCPEESLYMVPVGAVAYVTKARIVLCERCGTRMLGSGPPADLPPYTPAATPVLETTVASEFSRFNRKHVGQLRFGEDVDVRMRQTGEGGDT